jgi:hypothetical protein
MADKYLYSLNHQQQNTPLLPKRRLRSHAVCPAGDGGTANNRKGKSYPQQNTLLFLKKRAYQDFI